MVFAPAPNQFVKSIL